MDTRWNSKRAFPLPLTRLQSSRSAKIGRILPNTQTGAGAAKSESITTYPTCLSASWKVPTTGRLSEYWPSLLAKALRHHRPIRPEAFSPSEEPERKIVQSPLARMRHGRKYRDTRIDRPATSAAAGKRRLGTNLDVLLGTAGPQ